MKLKTVVLFSLVAFALTFGGVLIAGLVFSKSSSQTGTEDSGTGIGDGTTGQLSASNSASISPSVSDGAPSSTNAAQNSASAASTPATSATPAKTSTPAASSQAPAPTQSVAAPACGSAGGTCTTSQVATHNSAGNCWVIYNGGYYNVTSYVSIHPGGSSVFSSSTCGKDITAYLNGSSSVSGAKHRHSNSAYSTLNSYYIGKVQ